MKTTKTIIKTALLIFTVSILLFAFKKSEKETITPLKVLLIGYENNAFADYNYYEYLSELNKQPLDSVRHYFGLALKKGVAHKFNQPIQFIRISNTSDLTTVYNSINYRNNNEKTTVDIETSDDAKIKTLIDKVKPDFVCVATKFEMINDKKTGKKQSVNFFYTLFSNKLTKMMDGMVAYIPSDLEK